MPDTRHASAPRILIVADNASATFGGEAILPLKYFTLLARRGRDVRLITHERNRVALCKAFPDLMDRIYYSRDTRMHRVLWRIGARFPGVIRDHLFGNLMGMITGWQQRKMARDLVNEGGVDLVHQPIPVSPAAPSMLYGLGVPVVIGPMNGGMLYPPGYEDFEGRLSRLFVTIGRPLAGLINRIIPGKRRAAMLLVANDRTAKALPMHTVPVIELVENAVDFGLWSSTSRMAHKEGAFRLVYMGRLYALKGLDITIDALAEARTRLPEIELSMDILGDGPELEALQAQVERLGLADVVRFPGFLPQSECAQYLANGDALILGSLRECGGAVVLEAMAMGLAVIASDWGGPADYLDDTCGILVHPAPRNSFAKRQADAIVGLATDPERTKALGKVGAERVRSIYDWQGKIDQIEALYLQALSRKE
jgi:glycosyltransferase involved in cell wall biosynthesis